MYQESMRCSLCGLGYIPSIPVDNRMHERIHKEWLDVAEKLGMDPSCSHDAYEGKKRELRDIFCNSARPTHVRVEAAG